MRRLLAITSLVVLLLPSALDAQSLSNKERRYINSRVLTVIEEYERYFTLHDEEAEYMFMNLFENPSSPVFCDMIGFESYLRQMPVADYVSALKSGASTVTFVMNDVRKGEMTFSDGVWHIPVTFTKSISYIDGNGYVFSTDGYYGKDMDMTMNILYNPEGDLCCITSIEGRMDSDKTFPEGRFLIINSSYEDSIPEKQKKYTEGLKVGGSEITYNAFGQAILPSGEATVRDVDVLVLTDTLTKGQNYDVVSFGFDPRKARMKIRCAMAPFGAYDIKASDGILTESGAMEARLDFGGAWSAGRSTKMAFYAGVGVSLSRVGLSLESPVSYSYSTSVVPSGMVGTDRLFTTQTVDYSVDTATEGLEMMDVLVPVYFEFEHRAGGHVLISWSVGVKAYYNLYTEYVPYMAGGTRTVTDDIGSSAVNSAFSREFTSFIAPTSCKRNPFDVSAMADFGLDINLAKKKFYLSLRGGYEYGITTSYASEGNPYSNVASGIYPMVYDPQTGNDVAMHSLVSRLSYRRQAIWLELGFKFKM